MNNLFPELWIKIGQSVCGLYYWDKFPFKTDIFHQFFLSIIQLSVLQSIKKCAEGIENDFHTYPDCWVALFHYIALHMTDSSVINFRLDLVVPHPIPSLIIEGIFLCCTLGHCIHCAYICISWAAEQLLLNWESVITCTHTRKDEEK